MRVCYNGGYRTCAIHLRARSFGRACGGRLGERSPQPRLAAEMGKKAKGGGGGDKAAGPLPCEAEAKLLLHVAESSRRSCARFSSSATRRWRGSRQMDSVAVRSRLGLRTARDR